MQQFQSLQPLKKGASHVASYRLVLLPSAMRSMFIRAVVRVVLAHRRTNSFEARRLAAPQLVHFTDAFHFASAAV